MYDTLSGVSNIIVGSDALNSGIKLFKQLVQNEISIDDSVSKVLSWSNYKVCAQERIYKKIVTVSPSDYNLRGNVNHTLFYTRILADGLHPVHSDAGVIIRIKHTRPILIPETVYIGMDPIQHPEGRTIIFCLHTYPSVSNSEKKIKYWIRCVPVSWGKEWNEDTKFLFWER